MKFFKPCTRSDCFVAEEQLVLKGGIQKAYASLKKKFSDKIIELENSGMLLIFYDGCTLQLNRKGFLVIKKLKGRKKAEQIIKKIKEVVE